MKTIEQKAKAYDEALKWMRSLYPTMTGIDKEDAEHYFPELRESEDERIRKELIYHIQNCDDTIDEETEKRMVAWLEKQGEQSFAIRWHDVSLIPREMEELLVEWDSNDATWHDVAFYHADSKTFWNGERRVEDVTRWCYIDDLLERQDEQKLQGKTALEVVNEERVDNQNCVKSADELKHKFKVGDWLQYRNAKPFLVEEITKQGYVNGDSCLPFDWENEIRLWTIQDAKGGDVLVDKYNNIGIFQECKGLCWHSYIYLGCDGELWGFDIGGSHEQTDAHPSTKEQRDALTNAMADAGYTFDFEKKELKKVEQKPADAEMKELLRTEYEKGRADAIAETQVAWSEEDEKMLGKCIDAASGYYDPKEKDSMKLWLKDLKQRITNKQ